jgi:hypothetical protein
MASFDREALRAFADRVGEGSCIDTFIDTLARARDAWSSLRDRATSPHRAAIAEHWRRVPLLAELGGVSD